MRICIVLPFYLFTFLSLSAQTFTQRLQQSAKGEGCVTVHQDMSIDNLVNGIAAPTPAPKTETPKKVTAEEPKNLPEVKKATEPDDKTVTAVQQTAIVPALADTASTVKKSGQVYKVTGYRLQVFAGGNSRQDKRKAEQIGSQLRSLFPSEAVYTHFYPPRWICRMGNYRTYEEAHKILQEVKRQGFTSATVVKGKISVQY